MLIRLLKHPHDSRNTQQVRLPTQLIVRQSTGPPSG